MTHSTGALSWLEITAAATTEPVKEKEVPHDNVGFHLALYKGLGGAHMHFLPN